MMKLGMRLATTTPHIPKPSLHAAPPSNVDVLDVEPEVEFASRAPQDKYAILIML
jgi:hypothetical protein